MGTAPETPGASRRAASPVELWVGGTIVALLALAYLAGPGLDARMTDDSLRDFIRLKDCSAAAQAAGRYCDLGTGTSAGRLMHGTLWMRLLVLAAYSLRISPATQAAMMSIAVAAATGVMFALMRPLGGRALALATAAVFLALTGATGFPDFTNGFTGYLPAAVFFLGLSRISAGGGLRWQILSGLALYPCIEAHVASFALVPVLLWVTAASPGTSRRGVGVAAASLFTPALLLSRLNYSMNFIADAAVTSAFFAACFATLILARFTRARWQRLSLEIRLGLTATTTVVGAYSVGCLAVMVRGWPQNAYYLVPLLPLIAPIIVIASWTGLRMLPALPGRIALAGALGVLAWISRPPFLIPLVPVTVMLLWLTGWASMLGGARWTASIALGVGAWILTSPDGPSPWKEVPFAARIGLAAALPLLDALWLFAARRIAQARNGALQAQPARELTGRFLPKVETGILTAAVIVVTAGTLVWRHGVWTNGLWSGEATIDSAQVLSTDFRSHGWTCQQARLAEGLSVWRGDQRAPFECVLLDGGAGSSSAEVVVRRVPAMKSAVPRTGFPAWDSIDLGHDRVVLVSSITPWIRRDEGTGQVSRDGATLARFNILPLWLVDGHRDWEDVFNSDYPFLLSRLAVGVEEQKLAGAAVRYDFPIMLAGTDSQREIDLSNESIPDAAWRIDRVDGIDHTLDVSGLHVSLRRGGASMGTLSLIRTGKGEHDIDDAPIELLETTPDEAAIRALFVKGWSPAAR